mgnify:FL=1
MSDEIVAATDDSWFDNQLREWAGKGWDIEEVADYLNENSANATEAFMRVEYLIGASEQLIARMNYDWLERIDISSGLFAEWSEALANPMNFEQIVVRYEEWAKHNRRWELVLHNSQRNWESVMLGTERTLVLARCDSLDESSKPAINLLIPMMSDPNLFSEIDTMISEIEENEARQKRTVYAAIESLQSDGYEVEYIAKMNLVDAINEITHRQKLHNLHEIIRLQIIDEIAEYDDELANEFETQRKLLLSNDSEEAILELSKQVSNMGLDLKKRLSIINLEIANWAEAGIVFPTAAIVAKDMFEWETNLPELTIDIEKHLVQVERYNFYSNRMDGVGLATQYIGYLDQTDTLTEIVDELELRWQEAELECYSIIEKFQGRGLVLDDWNNRIEADPINSLNLIKLNSEKWQKRLDCIDKLLKIDISFEGKNDVVQRINLLREIEAGEDVIQDTEAMIERLVRRRSRHRTLLEKELMELIAVGKASEDTASNKFDLAGFEDFVANARKHGSTDNATLSGNSIISGKISQRITEKIDFELNLFEAAGWYVNDIRSIFDSNPMRAAKLLSDVRNHMSNHDALRRRLVSMPWNRNVALALQIQEEMRDPLRLAKITEQIPAMMKTLATSEVEDEDFTFTPWKPTPIRKTLLPIPEQMLQTNDTLEDAHEAMLESMEHEEQDLKEENVREDEIIREDGLTDHEFWEDEKWSAERWRWWREKHGEKEEAVNTESPLEDVEPESSQQKTSKSIKLDESIEIEHLHIIMKRLGLDEEYNQDADTAQQISEIRRSLAKNVGIEPRDIRVDRMLRLILRLLPQSNEHDNRRKLLIMKIASGLKRYQNWIKMRLEARHKAGKNNLILDSATLGRALERIPGPGFRVPLERDEKELPALNEMADLAVEVDKLISTMNLSSSSGVVVSAQ